MKLTGYESQSLRSLKLLERFVMLCRNAVSMDIPDRLKVTQESFFFRYGKVLPQLLDMRA
jgi:hypothetical protein